MSSPPRERLNDDPINAGCGGGKGPYGAQFLSGSAPPGRARWRNHLPMVRLGLDADRHPFRRTDLYRRRRAHGGLPRPFRGLSLDRPGEAGAARAAASLGLSCYRHSPDGVVRLRSRRWPGNWHRAGLAVDAVVDRSTVRAAEQRLGDSLDRLTVVCAGVSLADPDQPTSAVVLQKVAAAHCGAAGSRLGADLVRYLEREQPHW